MPDQFTETKTTGYGSRIINSIKGVLFGFILFVGSFGLLYWNEGRDDFSKVAKTATEVSSQSANTNPSLNGKLISTTGNVTSNETISDNLFLKPNKWIAVERKVEMYAWVEKSTSKGKTNLGGSKTTETTTQYSKEWTANPKRSGDFKHPEGHENPQKTVQNSTNKVRAATLGAFSFDPQSIVLPNLTSLPLNDQNTTLSQGATLANDNTLFVGKSGVGTFDNPAVGDLRISYSALYSNFTGTIFGKLNGGRIESYFDPVGNRLYRLFIGTRDEGIAKFHSEYTTKLWLFRLGGFLMMWFGLLALFGPISVLLDVLPIFGALSKALIALITFVISLVLTVVTMLVSMILHSLIALAIALAVSIGAIVIFLKLFKNKKGAAAPVQS